MTHRARKQRLPGGGKPQTQHSKVSQPILGGECTLGFPSLGPVCRCFGATLLQCSDSGLLYPAVADCVICFALGAHSAECYIQQSPYTHPSLAPTTVCWCQSHNQQGELSPMVSDLQSIYPGSELFMPSICFHNPNFGFLGVQQVLLQQASQEGLWAAADTFIHVDKE